MSHRRILALLALLLSACTGLSPPRTTLAERLGALPREGLPLERQVTIRWNAHQVPFIEAGTDRDLAFALGLVHAHLRLGQLELFRHAVRGRLSELGGPFARDLDHALRIVDLGRAAPRILEVMAPEDREFLEAYVAGINWVVEHAKELPPDFGLLGLGRERFTPEDVVAMGRLAGVDVNWFVLGALVRARDRADFPRIWAETLAAGSGGITSFGGDRPSIEETALGLSRSGSNSLVVGPARSTTGAPLVANDPHLGVTVPNFWVLAGVSSPSYHAVGLTIPGTPVVALGRSERLAWGGTNMRGAASDLVDVTGRADAQVTARRVLLRTRGWTDADRMVRDSHFGPIVSDIPLLGARTGELIALRWTGHEPSDEIGAFLRAMKARDVDGFRAAFAGFAVSPQNMLVADVDGNIGQVLAARLPRRTWKVPGGPVITAAEATEGWATFADARDLPFAKNPPEGFIASANNRPTGGSDVPIGWFFSADERIGRLKALVTAKDRVSPGDLKALQRDVVSTHARDLARAFLAHVEANPGLAARGPTAVEALRGWDGGYQAAARAPVAFETLLFHVLPATYGVEKPADLPPHLQSWNVLVKVLPEDLAALPAERRAAVLGDALLEAEKSLRRFGTWGDMHKLDVAGLLARAPLIGRAFRYEEIAASGSRETVMKSAHGVVDGKHGTFYGSQARHVSDLSDLDANWFVLIGGQDGWPGSDTFLDQVGPWTRGEYLRMPLRPATVAAEFPFVTVLEPVGR